MAPRFVGFVDVRQIGGGYWMLLDPLAYRGSHVVEIPAHFFTDFASIPRPLWNVIDPTDPRISGPSLAHDRAYETHELARADADDLLYEAMGAVDEPAGLALRNIVWAAVRAGGRRAYETASARQAARRIEYLRSFARHADAAR